MKVEVGDVVKWNGERTVIYKVVSLRPNGEVIGKVLWSSNYNDYCVLSGTYVLWGFEGHRQVKAAKWTLEDSFEWWVREIREKEAC